MIQHTDRKRAAIQRQRAPTARRNAEIARLHAEGASQVELAERYGVSKQRIGQIVRSQR